MLSMWRTGYTEASMFAFGSILVLIGDSEGSLGRQIMIRFPLPYRIGENCCPGNADEKVRCEVGTYAWLQENCPVVPIPPLYGFGLCNDRTVCYLFALSPIGVVAYGPSLPISITSLFSIETFSVCADGFCRYYATNSHPYMPKTISKIKPSWTHLTL